VTGDAEAVDVKFKRGISIPLLVVLISSMAEALGTYVLSSVTKTFCACNLPEQKNSIVKMNSRKKMVLLFILYL
jgi:hypothetical protein